MNVRASVVLHPGEVFVGEKGERVSTVLGSCIAVCVYVPRLRLGGMNHFLMTRNFASSALEARMCGETAIPQLIQAFKQRGCRPDELVVKVVGGAQSEDYRQIGIAKANIELARRLLREFGLSIRAESVGGTRGRKVVLDTGTGELLFQTLPEKIDFPLLFHPRVLSGGLIAIGASTGGAEAIRTVLRGLPSKIPPILIVQHMPPEFTRSFAASLDGHCPFTVKEARDGEPLQADTVYVAPGDFHLRVRRRRDELFTETNQDPPRQSFRPSVDYLYASMRGLDRRLRGAVLLTGMGRDGADEMRALRDEGVFTLAQDESSSTIFGMPKCAIECGAACQVAPLGEISATLVRGMNALAVRHRARLK